MSYTLPHYVISKSLNNPVINYTWYDPNPNKVFSENIIEQGQHVVNLIRPVTLRAKIALMIGVHEWVLGRFLQLTNKALPFQMAEASWCANVNVDYVPYFELNVDEFIGPIDRALFYSTVCLHNVIFVSDNIYDLDDLEDEEKDPEYFYSGDEWEVNLRDMIALTLHIIPSDKVVFFERWLEITVSKLISLYSPKIEPDPLDNLFGQDNNLSLLGDYVAREVLDPEFPFDKEQTVTLINHYFSTVDKNNPLLRPIKQMKNRIPDPYKVS